MTRAPAGLSFLLLSAALCSASCTHPSAVRSATAPKRVHRAPRGKQLASLRNLPPPPATGAHPEPAQGPLPLAVDVSRQVMGWVVLSDGRALAPMVPGPDAAVDALERERAVLGVLLGVDRRVTSVIDLTRPVAVAVLNPTLLKGSGTVPFLALLPVASPTAMEKALVEAGMTIERTSWGLVARSAAATLCMSFTDGGYATVAGRPELMGAVQGLLGAPLATAARERAEVPLRIHLAVDNVFEAYGAQIDGVLGRVLSGSSDKEKDRSTAFSLRGVRHAAQLARGLKTLDLLVAADGDGLALRLRAEGPAEGAWAGFVASQQPAPSPVWGARLVPRDAVMAVASHRSLQTANADVESLIAYLVEANGAGGAARQAQWRAALGQVLPTLTGEVVYALWPGVGGGVGMGGAYHVVGGAGAARQRVMAAYHTLEPDLAVVVRRALDLDASRPVRVKLVKRAAVMSGVPVDTFAVSVSWPRDKQRAERRRFESRFGPTLVLATAFVDDTALFAVGRDWRTRLPVLINATRGRSLPSLAEGDPEFSRALQQGGGGRVSLSWLGTRPMAHLLDALAREGGAPNESMMALAPMVAAIDRGAVITTSRVDGHRYEVASRIPISLLGELPRLGGVLWRLGLAPLLDPPSLPPLPLPPAHLSPGFPAAREAALP